MSQRRSQEEVKYGSLQKAWKILKIFCCPPCPPCIISKLAFHPPTPPSYKTAPPGKDNPNSSNGEKLRMILLEGGVTREVPEVITFVRIRRCLCSTRRIAVMLWSLPQPSDLIILHSHVNGADLGGLYDYMVYLRSKLKCEIVSYDYCGYGVSSGTASEANVLKAGVAVMDYVTQTLKKPLKKVILYGQSIGSVPTAYLASKYEVGGVVFHAGLYSGLRLLVPNKRGKAMSGCVDPFRNVDFISQIRSPVLFIHGTKDAVIPVSHAMDLYRMCKTAVKPLWIEGGGHTGLELKQAFFDRLREFFQFVRQKEAPLANGATKDQRLKTQKSKSKLKLQPKAS